MQSQDGTPDAQIDDSRHQGNQPLARSFVALMFRKPALAAYGKIKWISAELAIVQCNNKPAYWLFKSSDDLNKDQPLAEPRKHDRQPRPLPPPVGKAVRQGLARRRRTSIPHSAVSPRSTDSDRIRGRCACSNTCRRDRNPRWWWCCTAAPRRRRATISGRAGRRSRIATASCSCCRSSSPRTIRTSASTGFSPATSSASKGEALSIRQMVETMIRDHGIDPGRVFVTGLSAGGAMTVRHARHLSRYVRGRRGDRRPAVPHGDERQRGVREHVQGAPAPGARMGRFRARRLAASGAVAAHIGVARRRRPAGEAGECRPDRASSGSTCTASTRSRR